MSSNVLLYSNLVIIDFPLSYSRPKTASYMIHSSWWDFLHTTADLRDFLVLYYRTFIFTVCYSRPMKYSCIVQQNSQIFLYYTVEYSVYYWQPQKSCYIVCPTSYGFLYTNVDLWGHPVYSSRPKKNFCTRHCRTFGTMRFLGFLYSTFKLRSLVV